MRAILSHLHLTHAFKAKVYCGVNHHAITQNVVRVLRFLPTAAAINAAVMT